VSFTDGSKVTYDYLVVATGAQSDYFGHAEWSTLAPSLKTLADAMAMRSRVLGAFERAEEERDPDKQRAHLTFIVVGGGPTGVELAAAIAELARHSLRGDFRHIDPASAKVLLLDAGKAILASYAPALQEKALEQLASLGVEVRTQCSVEGIDEDGVFLEGKRIAARTILWAAGVRATPLARSIGVPLDHHGRVSVTPTLRAPGLPSVFVIGDLAALELDGKPVPGVAPAAMQEGRFAGRAIAADIAGNTVEPFHYVNRGELTTVGRSMAVAALPGGLQLSGFVAWIICATVHLYYLLGAVNRVRVFSSWVWSFVTYGRRARLIAREWTEATPHARSAESVPASALLAAERPPPHAPGPPLH
jgi:NADH dehydrogenase